jgi:hypothetical protein
MYISIARKKASSMLAPLDRVEIDAFLHKFPQRTEFSQESDALFDGLEDIVDLAGRGKTANAKTNAAMGTLIAVAESSKDIARFKRRGSTGASGRQGDILESHEKTFALNIGKRNVDATGITSFRVAVHGGMLHGKKAIGKSLGEGVDTLCIILSSVALAAFQ